MSHQQEQERHQIAGSYAPTNVRLFLKHHRQAIQHKYDISALVIRASKQCSDYRRVYNCCDV